MSLWQSDTAEIKVDIFAKDKEVNARERDVRKKVLTHLAHSGGADLTSGLILVSVSSTSSVSAITPKTFTICRASTPNDCTEAAWNRNSKRSKPA
jgi:hypothetical protein